ncbi:hypothetical protein [Nonomuraea sp. NPDC048826]|uniref:hypothetical protein n=1 Tax=Nonomuraea sp. NPDC048826 TaxID=3364347 RepID=UPI003722F973
MSKNRKYGILFTAVMFFVVAVGGMVIPQVVGPWDGYVDPGRARRVLVNAFALANPGYTVDYFGMEDRNFDIHPQGGVITIPLSARAAYMRSLNHQWHRFSTEVNLSSDMTVQAPSLAETPTTIAIDSFSDAADTTARTSGYARKILAGMDQPVAVTAVVKLRTPQAEEDLVRDLRMWDSRIGAVVLRSDDNRAQLLTWAGGACGVMGFDCGDAGNLRTRQFQKWVASLTEEDADALAAFDIDLPSLQDSSTDPLVSGFVVTAAPADIRELQDNPKVQWIRLTDIAFDYAE